MRKINIGLIGLGVIGSQVAKTLLEKQLLLAQAVGMPIELKKIKVAPVDLQKPLAEELGRNLFTTDEEEFFNNNFDVIVEAMGGEYPALEYLTRALRNKCHVVTSNKEVLSKHLKELTDLAAQNNVSIRAEASVGGGIPLMLPLQEGLTANTIHSILAIINGTTNYILTRMKNEGDNYEECLREAQDLGYAEPNPINDVEGYDAAYKLSIMASLAFGLVIAPQDIYCEGITKLSAADFKYADSMGYVIRLLAIGKENEQGISVRVHPAFISKDKFLAKVDGVYNAVLFGGDLVGEVLFMGQGAGDKATTSAVMSDVINCCADVINNSNNRNRWQIDQKKKLTPISNIETRYYVRLLIADRPGVLASVAKCLGDHNISIASALQQERDNDAEVVIMTHTAIESAMQKAINQLNKINTVLQVSNIIRVEE
ncbi:MAG: homoserine dehydrogenase [Chloroflexi bacterium]|nr:homoserine dehydrogenase [Chloroflexota bacterium]